MGEDELAEIRRRKLAELQAEAQERQEAEERAARIQAERQALLRAILEPEARERLARVRLARPEIAESLEAQLLALAQSGRLAGKITDEMLRQIIQRVAPRSKDIRIERR